MTAAGYLVVLRDASALSPRNPSYRGLYRVPPFVQGRFDEGFDDPYLLDPRVMPNGLLPSLDVAQEFLETFRRDHQAGELEIIRARTCEDDEPGETAAPHTSTLGFDVAAFAPFWSILADISIAPDADQEVGRFLSLRNQNGLFPDPDAARAYRDYYTSASDEAAGVDLRIWEVSEVPATG
jgi:hypothetical protein